MNRLRFPRPRSIVLLWAAIVAVALVSFSVHLDRAPVHGPEEAIRL